MVAAIASSNLRCKLVEPEIFDGCSTSPQAWMDLYEYACRKNSWTSDDEKITKLRPYLSKMARCHFDLGLTEGVGETWNQWKLSFLGAFQENAVEQWDRRRALQAADSNLPEMSVVPLVIRRLSCDLQKQVQSREPKTILEFVSCFRDFTVDWPVPARISGMNNDDHASNWTPSDPRPSNLHNPWTSRHPAVAQTLWTRRHPKPTTLTWTSLSM